MKENSTTLLLRLFACPYLIINIFLADHVFISKDVVLQVVYLIVFLIRFVYIGNRMNFSVCIDSVFQGMDSVSAMEHVKAAGFGAFEFWMWQNRDIDAMAAKARELGLSCVCLCTRFFDLANPGNRETFLSGIADSIPVAKKMNAPFLITQSGNDTGAVRPFQHRSVVEGLKSAAPMLEKSGVTLLLEPLNGKINHPGIFLESSDEGFEIIREVSSPNVKLLFDIYHQQITEGDVVRRMTSNIDCIGHIHCAGNPGRHELDSGELDYRRILAALERAGYKGWAGIEYFPLQPALEGLKRLKGII